MSTQHIVTAAAVKVSIGGPGGNRVASFLRRGDVLPEGIADEQIERLIDRGLIESEEVTETEEEGEPISEDEGAYKGITVADLKVEIAKRNEGRKDADKVVPAEPGNRAEIVAALIADDTE